MPIAIPLIGAAATIGGALISSNAAGNAASAQLTAAQMAQQQQAQELAFQKGIYGNQLNAFQGGRAGLDSATNMVTGAYNTLSGNLQSGINLGQNATNSLSAIYGFGSGGPGSQSALDAFTNTPDYQFALQQGTRALDMSAASKGLLTSGGMVRASQDYGQGLASQQYGNVINRLMGMMNYGQSSSNSLANAGINAGNTIGNLNNAYTNIGANTGSGIGYATGQTSNNMGNFTLAGGQAAASGIMGAANPWVSALNTGPGNALAAYTYANNNASSFPNPFGGQPSSSSYVQPGVNYAGVPGGNYGPGY